MKTVVLIGIRMYKRLFSPAIYTLFGNGCRFYPTCSEYAEISINKFGIVKGVWLTIKRLSKCHPLNNSNYLDPVPEY